MNQDPDRDTMRPEYDFTDGVKGKHHRAYRQGTNVVLLDPDVADVFKDAAAVTRRCARSRKWRSPMPTANVEGMPADKDRS